jgi:hypothetical protein
MMLLLCGRRCEQAPYPTATAAAPRGFSEVMVCVTALIRHTSPGQAATHGSTLLLQMLLMGHHCRCRGCRRRMAKMQHTGSGGSRSGRRSHAGDSMNMMVVIGRGRRHNGKAGGGVEGAGGRGGDHTAGRWWAGRQEDGRAGPGSWCHLLRLEQLAVLVSSWWWLLLAYWTSTAHYQRWTGAGTAAA